MPKKFDFISPGVQLNEVDQSQLPQPVSDAGPVLIGRARSGPGMKPIRLNSYEDFLAILSPYRVKVHLMQMYGVKVMS